jgi:N-acetylglucosaminyl-diphospho-decaprenol L-rhamnosyltransferase
VALIRRRHPHVTVLANERNVGYGAAVNQGVARCSSDYILILNSDTRVVPGTLQNLARYLDHNPRVAIVGPRLTRPDGRLQPSCQAFPTLLPTLLEESATWPLLGYVPWLREVYPPTASHARPRRVAWVEGAAMAARRVAFEAVSGFDESFFMYFEEVDLCYRLAVAGWQVHFAPVGTVVHVGGASTRLYRGDMAVQAMASRLHFYRKHYTALQQVILVLLMEAIVLARCLVGQIRVRHPHNDARRSQLLADLVVWRRALRGEWIRLPARNSAG